MSTKINSFTDLKTWQEGHKFVLMTYKYTSKLPADEKFGLISQMRRAAVSITSNIAEGFRRSSKNDKKQFYVISLSSLTELQNQLLICKDLQFINEQQFKELSNQSVLIAKMIQGLIKSVINR